MYENYIGGVIIKHKNLNGLKFGKLTAIEENGKLGNDIAYLCKCDCGNEKTIRACNLVKGDTKSCGCIRKSYEDLTGNIYGNWLVLEYKETDEKGTTKWKCKCMCEKETLKIIDRRTLIRGHSKSCGCIKNKTSTTHGKSTSNDRIDKKIYRAWSGMKDRCNNVNSSEFNNYGARGIKVCDEWLGEDGFVNFYNWSIEKGVTFGLSIDRVDVNGNYEPFNCRWVDIKIQNNNKRNNVYLEFNGKRQSLSMWEDELGFSKKSLTRRLKRGWSVERALTTPQQKRRKKGEL